MTWFIDPDAPTNGAARIEGIGIMKSVRFGCVLALGFLASNHGRRQLRRKAPVRLHNAIHDGLKAASGTISGTTRTIFESWAMSQRRFDVTILDGDLESTEAAQVDRLIRCQYSFGKAG